MQSRDKPSPSQDGGDKIDALFVNRLQRLIRMRHDYRDDLNPLGLRLLDRAIYATYRDCIEFGAAKQARELVADLPSLAGEVEP